MRHELVSMDELLPGEPRAVDVDGLSILIVRTPDDQVFALRNVCSHMGAKLSNGRVYCPLKGRDAGRYELADTYVIQCPWHGIEFDVATGRSLADPERTRLRRFKRARRGRHRRPRAMSSTEERIMTGSCAALKGYANVSHYVATKHGVVGLMRSLALELAPLSIRVNSVHPTQVDTPMTMNDAMYRLFRPDLEHPTQADFAPASQAMLALPIPWVDAVDVSNAVLFLASDEARYITGVPLPVDGGVLVK